MNTTILIASYSKDKEYLLWCLKSIRKFATGFDGVTVVVPWQERQQFADITDQAIIQFYVRIEDQSRWQLHAQVAKCFADRYCPLSNFILHMDSDCIFTEPVTPQDYFVDGKPVMLIEEFSRMPDSPWKAVTERALGMPVQFETMRRHPQLHPLGLYAAMRKRIEEVHKKPFQDYVLGCAGGFPFGFSEHCALGAFALSRPEWADKYHWIDLAKEQAPKEKVKQFWSIGPIDQPQGTPHDKDRLVPLDFCKAVIG